MKNTTAFVLVISIILFSSLPVFALAGDGVPFIRADGSSSKQNKVQNSSQAARIVKSRVGGKVLKVKNDGRSGYKVKVIKDDGHIINVTVDAKSGRVKGR
ncbi:PepSY domain-containing protein [Pseudocolwellia agarivorans]|uniref:PepSY domain-containing protein n=1 Tax=Pseudocolwellia agarivorans TaxID=1911682 RepID=UPI000987B56F|nr:PepSY domain-containing protein [Pseudocolwellia agarivorans]